MGATPSGDPPWLLAGAPDTLPHRVPLRFRALVAALLLGLPVSLALASDGIAQDDPAQHAAMLRFENDASCAAAAESWLIGMPNGTSTKEQEDTWTLWAFYTRDAQASAQAAGRPAVNGIAAAQAFVVDYLPHLKSQDAAEADKAKAEAAEGTHACAARPEFQNRSNDAKP